MCMYIIYIYMKSEPLTPTRATYNHSRNMLRSTKSYQKHQSPTKPIIWGSLYYHVIISLLIVFVYVWVSLPSATSASSLASSFAPLRCTFSLPARSARTLYKHTHTYIYIYIYICLHHVI